MGFKSSLKLDSRFFDAGARKRAFAPVPYAAAQAFRQSLKQKMIDSVPAGRIESVGEGRAFDTRFRRSRRGQRPAIQTRKLISSIYAYRNGDYSARTEVTAENEDGENIGEILQHSLGRKVMTTDEDIKEAEKDFVERGKRALLSLL
jgi:hypothetical protein